MNVPGHALARQGCRIQRRLSVFNDPVDGHLLPGLHHDQGTDFHVCRVLFHFVSVFDHVRVVGPDVHEVRNALPALVDGEIFKELSHLEEEHDGHSLHVIARGGEGEDESADGRDGHEKALVEDLAIEDALPRFFQDVVADDAVGNQV